MNIANPMVADLLFASFDTDLHLERVAGGNETEVYSTDDRRWVVKVKHELDETDRDVFTEAKDLRAVAANFAQAIGPEHSLPNYFLISQNDEGDLQVVAFQPYLHHATPLFKVDYGQLSPAARQRIGQQLRQLIQRSLHYYREHGVFPDLYGRTSRSKAERRILNSLGYLPWRVWQFLVKRTLLRGHNLMLTEAPDYQIVLVDYDPVKRSPLYKWVYYNVRRLLFWRDYVLIALMEKTGYVPGG